MTIKIYSIIGQEIKTVVNGTVPAGQHELDLLAKNLSSGVYLCKMQSGKFSDIKNMIEDIMRNIRDGVRYILTMAVIVTRGSNF